MKSMFSPLIFSIAVFLVPSIADAALTLDRTRIIFNGDQKSVSVNVHNDNKKYPFLAQAWLENSEDKKITSPLIVTPPLQRLNAGEKNVIRIMASPAVATTLPQDRESVFYFNLREIPPKSDKPNVMQIAMQSRVKLFYRPKAIIAGSEEIWQDKVVFHKNSQGFTINNPTPYHVTISSLKHKFEKDGGGDIKNFTPVMVSPKSSLAINVLATPLQSFVMSYINDYGGHPEVLFRCEGQICRAVPTE